MNVQGVPRPEVGLIVKFNPATGQLGRRAGRDWSGAVSFELPDLDVFAIDAAAAAPVETASFAHVGTVLFNMATNPVNGKVYVSNTEARNEVRFEGPGLAFGSTTVQGHLHEARITVLDGANVLPRHLNKHIDYDQRPAPAGVKERSLATPTGMAVTADGATLYVAAFGSSAIGVFCTARARERHLRARRRDPHPPERRRPDRPRARRGPRPRSTCSRASTTPSPSSPRRRATEEAHLPVHTPEPPAILNGRRFLYDATLTSSNGEASCSSCHIFGDFDSLAWDLGNPDDVVPNNPLPFKIAAARPGLPSAEGPDDHAEPARHGEQRLHALARRPHRRQRPAAFDPFDEDAAFKKFNVAFPGLIGRDRAVGRRHAGVHRLHPDVTYPPNPIRRLNNTLNASSRRATTSSSGASPTSLFNCDGCHTLDPATACSAPTASRPSRARRRCSRSRTSATCTRRSACSAGRSDRAAGPAGPRLRLPARRQHRHGLPLPRRRRLLPDQRASSAASSTSCSRSTPTSRRSSASRSP